MDSGALWKSLRAAVAQFSHARLRDGHAKTENGPGVSARPVPIQPLEILADSEACVD
jgi:hypothetical protein